MKSVFIFILITVHHLVLVGQLTVQPGAVLRLQAGSEITLQGDLDSHEDITGSGTVNLNGTQIQVINLHAKNIFKLRLDNASHAQLSSAITITGMLELVNGHLQCRSSDVFLSANAVLEGGSAKAFIETNGSGQVVKSISQDLSGYLVPLGNVNRYTPLSLTSTGTYRIATVGLSSRNTASLHKPADAENYIENFWSISRKGIDGTLHVSGKYNDVNGDEQQLNAFYWDGKSWSSQHARFDPAKRTISVNATEGSGEIYAFEPGEGMAFEEELKIFPNPVVSAATVLITSKEAMERTLQVVDTKGRILLEKKVGLERGTNKVTLNFSSHSQGQYFIRLLSAGKYSMAFIPFFVSRL